MSMEKKNAEHHLVGLGFEQTESSRFGDLYELRLDDEWSIRAYASKAGNPFEDTDNENFYEKVVFSLGGNGTLHKCLSMKALENHSKEIIDSLIKVSKNKNLLICPKCKKRYVHAKEPSVGDKWKPFLSCNGMMIRRKGNKKDVECDGTSRKLPAVVTYA
jgi:hypothetical protein